MSNIYKNKILIVMLVLVLSFNVINAPRAQATGGTFLATLGSITAGSGGSALAVILPVLACIGLAYAGYEVYDNWDTIKDTFEDWYESASTTIKGWIDNTVNDIESGAITDGDTLSIPKEVVDSMRQCAITNAKNWDGSLGLQGNSKSFANVSEASSLLSHDHLKALVLNSTYICNSPMIIAKNKTTLEEHVCFMPNNYNLTYNNVQYEFDTLIINNTSKLTIGWTNQVLYNQGLLNLYTYPYSNATGTYKYYEQLSNGIYTGSSYYSSRSTTFLESVKGYNIVTSNNSMTDAEWTYDYTLVIPDDSMVLYTDQAVGDVYLNPTNSTVLYKPNMDIVENPYNISTITYNPDIVIDAAGNAKLEVELSPAVVQKISDIALDNEGNSSETVQTMQPDAVDTSKGILDVLRDLPGTIGDAIKDALEWLFVPDASKVDAFAIEASALVEGRAGLFIYPIELVVKFLNAVYVLGSTDCILIIPEIKFKGFVLYSGSEFNFTDFVEKSEFHTIYGIYFVITDFIMIIAILNLAIKKGSEIIRGN